MNKLRQLGTCGQSVWLDYLKRSVIENGELLNSDRARRSEGCNHKPFHFRESD